MKLARWLILFLLASPLLAQNVRWDLPIYTVQASGGNLLPVYAIPGARISFYNEPADTLANTYNSATSVTACPTSAQVVLNGTSNCVNNADNYGNMGSWFQQGQYKATITAQGVSYDYYFSIGGFGGGSGCTLGGINDTDVLSVHPVGDCYGSDNFTWSDVPNSFLNIGVTAAATADTGATDFYRIGPSNHITMGQSGQYIFGDSEHANSVAGGFNSTNVMTGYANTTTVSAPGGVLDTNNINGDSNTESVDGTSTIVDTNVNGDINAINATLGDTAEDISLSGCCNVVTANTSGNGIYRLVANGSYNTAEDTLNTVEDSTINGGYNDVNGAMSTVQIDGWLNSAWNVSNEGGAQVNTTLNGSQNHAFNTGGLAIVDFSMVSGLDNYIHDCSDCQARGTGVEESNNDEMALGMDRLAELKFTHNNVQRTPLTLGLPAPIANAYVVGKETGSPLGGTCTVAFTGGTGSGGAGFLYLRDLKIATGAPITITNGGSYSVAPTGATITNGTATCSASVSVSAFLAVVQACSSTLEGSFAAITDSSTAVQGAVISGGGTNHVFGYCDGTNWLVTNGPGSGGTTPVSPTNSLISGGGVVWKGGLDFTISAANYDIAATPYSSIQTDVTLATADPTNPRIDAFIVDNTGTASVLPGTPSATPAEPSVNALTQFNIGFVTIPAASAVPDVSEEDIYLENTEYTCTATANFNCASTSNPYQGTLDIEATAAVAGNNVTLVKPASGTVNLATFSTLSFYIRNKAVWPNAKSLTFTWLNGATVVGQAVSIKNAVYGFSQSNTVTYQQIVLPLPAFGTGNNLVTTLRVQVAGGGAAIGFYLDNILLQNNLNGSGSGNTAGVSQIVAGTNVTISPASGQGIVTINVPAAATPASLTGAASGGAAPGTTYNGSAPVTFDYHTLGAAQPLAACTDESSTFVPADGHCYFVTASVSTATPAASAFVVITATTSSGGTFALTGTTIADGGGCSSYISGTTLTLTSSQSVALKSDGTNIRATCTVTAAGSGLSGMTAGQFGLAGSASTITSSVPGSGSGNVCLTTNCVMTTPNLGTPSAATLTNATGYPTKHTIVFPFGTPYGAGATTTGISPWVTMPIGCTITGWSIQADNSTDTVKFLKVAAGTAIPTIANSINTSGVSLSTATAIQSTTLTDFTTTTVTANDIIAADLITTSGTGGVTAQLTLACTQ